MHSLKTPGEKSKFQISFLAWLGLGGLIIYQAWLYYFRLQLSLGPRVIFEPWALRGGFVLYDQITDIHPPLIPWLLAVLGYLIPNGLRLAKLVLVGLVTFSTILTFLIARRHSGNWAGLFASTLFVLWAPSFEFTKLWYEVFLTPIYLVFLLGFTPSDRPRSPRWWILWGGLGGIAVLIKQHAAIVFAAFLVWEAITARELNRSWFSIFRDLFFTGLFSLLPVLGAIVFQWTQTSSIDALVFWSAVYPFVGTYRELAVLPLTSRQTLFIAEICLLILPALIWLVHLVQKRDLAWHMFGLWAVFLITGGITAFPRFELFHLQPVVPILALFSVWILSNILRSQRNRAENGFSIGIAISVALVWILITGEVHLHAIQANEPRQIKEYSLLEPLAFQIQQVTGPLDNLYIFPDDEASTNLYYLLQCPPPDYWIFHYPWYMMEDVKSKILGLLGKSPPQWVLYRPDRWQVGTYAPEVVAYIQANYQIEATLSLASEPVQLMRRISRP